MSSNQYTVAITIPGYKQEFLSSFDTYEKAKKVHEVVAATMNDVTVEIHTVAPPSSSFGVQMEHLGHECTISTPPLLFTMTPHGKAQLIQCRDPSACEWWGEKYIALNNSSDDPPTAFWNDRL